MGKFTANARYMIRSVGMSTMEPLMPCNAICTKVCYSMAITIRKRSAEKQVKFHEAVRGCPARLGELGCLACLVIVSLPWGCMRSIRGTGLKCRGKAFSSPSGGSLIARVRSCS